VADIVRSTQEAGPIGRRKRNSCAEMGGFLDAFQAGGDNAPASRCLVKRGRGVLARKRSNKMRRIRIGFNDRPRIKRTRREA
jgi:hypothetical protein